MCFSARHGRLGEGAACDAVQERCTIGVVQAKWGWELDQGFAVFGCLVASFETVSSKELWSKLSVLLVGG